MQSPINILSTVPTVSNIGAITATGFGVDKPIGWRVSGTAGTPASATAVEAWTDDPAYISGGPLGDTSYRFSHIEFHWPNTAAGLGSEHSLDGTRAAMEMQFVHYKTQFP